MERQENKPTAKVLYRNDRLISDTLKAYKDAAATLQATLKDLHKQGIPLDDNILTDLYDHDGRDTAGRLKEAINAAAKSQPFEALKESTRKQLAPLYTEIQKAVDVIDKLLYASTYSGAVSLDLNHFTVSGSGLKVGLIEGLDKIVTDQHTIYEGADADIDEANRRALEIKEKIDDFTAFLKSKGDFLTPISGQRPILKVSTHPAYSVEVEPLAFQWVHKKLSNF